MSIERYNQFNKCGLCGIEKRPEDNWWETDCYPINIEFCHECDKKQKECDKKIGELRREYFARQRKLNGTWNSVVETEPKPTLFQYLLSYLK